MSPYLLQIRPGDSSNISALSAVEVIHLPHKVCSKDDAPENMMYIEVTLDTSHLVMSQLNDAAPANMPNMLVTLDTSHLERSLLNEDAE